jgi:hypothetical protein
MVEVFGGLLGVHKGLGKGLLRDPTWVKEVNNITKAEHTKAKKDACEAVKAAMVISGADKCRYEKLKNEPTNSSLLFTNQYPDMFDKALHILGNYQTSRPTNPFRPNPNNTGVAFLQQGGQGGQGRGGHGKEARRGDEETTGADAGGGGNNNVSAITGVPGGGAVRTNS